LKIKLTLVILGILLLIKLFGQDQQRYLDLINQARKFYDNKEYLKAGQKYSEAFKSTDNTVPYGDRINAVCAWSQVN